MIALWFVVCSLQFAILDFRLELNAHLAAGALGAAVRDPDDSLPVEGQILEHDRKSPQAETTGLHVFGSARQKVALEEEEFIYFEAPNPHALRILDHLQQSTIGARRAESGQRKVRDERPTFRRKPQFREGRVYPPCEIAERRRSFQSRPKHLRTPSVGKETETSHLDLKCCNETDRLQRRDHSRHTVERNLSQELQSEVQ